MKETTRILITIPPKTKEKAEKESAKLFGKSNVSGFIAMLIQKYKAQ